MRWLVVVVVVLVALVIHQFVLVTPPTVSTDLKGTVAVVTGASRGIGKGIAIGLGEQGATVYITGRTLKKGQANTAGVGGKSQVGSLEEACAEVVAVGGVCIPVVTDSGDDAQIAALFDRVIEEQGRLDILVNNAFSAVNWLPKHTGKPFWEKGTDAWDIVNGVGLRSHYIASVHAAKAMAKRRRGIIINISSFGGLNYIFDVAYGVGKAAMDRMANDMAIELHTENITMVSLWPGLVQTENVQDGALNGPKERRGQRPGTPEFNMAELFGTPLAETPLYTGRAVAALARDQAAFSMTGKILVTANLAARYGFSDEHDFRPPPFTSVKFILGAVLGKLGLVSMAGEAAATSPFWSTMPNLAFPGWLLKLDVGAPNL